MNYSPEQTIGVFIDFIRWSKHTSPSEREEIPRFGLCWIWLSSLALDDAL
jgi:hypothetical protein